MPDRTLIDVVQELEDQCSSVGQQSGNTIEPARQSLAGSAQFIDQLFQDKINQIQAASEEVDNKMFILHGLIGGQAEFSPEQIDNLDTWLLASEGIVLNESSKLVSWTDQSDNGIIYTPYGDLKYTVDDDAINGKPAVLRNDGAWLAASNAPAVTVTGYTMFIVAKKDATGDPRNLCSFTTDPYGIFMHIAIASYFGAAFNLRGDEAFDYTSANVGPWVLAIRFDGTGTGNNGRLKAYVNGNLQTLNDGWYGITIESSYTLTGQRHLFHVLGGSGASFWGGPIAEQVGYDRALSDDEMGQVTDYLINRYGIE